MKANQIIIDDIESENLTDDMKENFKTPIKVERRPDGSVVLIQNGMVVGTLQGKKKSYSQVVQERFQEKRRLASLEKQTKQQSIENEQ